MPRDVLLSAEGQEDLEQRITQSKGRVTHRFAGGLLIARFPDSARFQGLEAGLTSREFVGHKPANAKEKVLKLVAKAWAANINSGPDLAPTAEEGVAWTDQNFTAPAFNTGAFEAELSPLAPANNGAVALSTGTPTSRYMVGSIALGLVIVSGDKSALAFTDAEKEKIIEQVQRGRTSWPPPNPGPRSRSPTTSRISRSRPPRGLIPMRATFTSNTRWAGATRP